MKIVDIISNYSILIIIFYIIMYGVIHKTDVYSCFIKGVKDGFKLVIDILPTLVALLFAVSIIRSSNFLDFIAGIFTPLAAPFDIPSEIIPVAIIKMFSSSAATGMMLDIFKTTGPDSPAGIMSSIILSSTETIFYVISVYYLSIGITKSRWTLPAAFIATISGIIASICVAKLMF